MKKLFNLIIFSFFFLTLNAQLKTSENIFINSRLSKGIDNRDHSVKGSIYLSENFMPIKIKGFKENFVGRIDAFNNELEISLRNQTIYLNKTLNTEVTFIHNNSKYVVFNEVIDNDKQPTFFKLQQDSEIKLLIKEKIKFYKEISANNGIGKFQHAQYKRAKNEIYLGLPNKTAIKLPKKKKEFLKIFGQNKVKVEQFIKKNKLNHKSILDLEQILDAYLSQ